MRAISCLVAMLMAFPAWAWDPMSVLQGALQQQSSRQINQGVAQVFKSITQPSVSARTDAVSIQGLSGDGIVMYGTTTCGYCKQARAHMQARGIAFIDKDIDSDEIARREFTALGGRGYPLILIGRQKLSGFSPVSFDRLYAQYAAEHGIAVDSPKPTSTAMTAQDALRPGDILVGRIAGVKVLGGANPSATTLVELKKREEIVYLGDRDGLYLHVKSATTEGWVDSQLVGKP